MRWVYVTVIVVVFVRLALIPQQSGVMQDGIVETIVAETGVPNSVAGVLLRNRLYDTVFEVFVFTLAIMGVQYAFSLQRPEQEVYHLTDDSMVILARTAAMISALVFLELALRGHLAPGGGFAAGVAGGTAIGLTGLTTDVRVLYSVYEKWHIASIEKLLVLLILVSATVFLLLSTSWTQGGPGTAWVIQIFNLLIAVKVAIGSWTLVLLFIRHRGLL